MYLTPYTEKRWSKYFSPTTSPKKPSQPYENMKVKVCSPDGDTDYFNIVTGVLQGNILGPYLFIICQDCVLRTSIDLMKDNGFKLAKKRSKRYSAQDITLITNTPAQAESMLHNLERAVGGLGLHINADKTEYICFNQRGDISTLKDSPLKLVDKFTYHGSSVSSTEKDIHTRLAKAWIATIGFRSCGSQTWTIK